MKLPEFIRDLHRDVSQFDSTWASTHSEDMERDVGKWWEDFKAYVDQKDALQASQEGSNAGND